MHFPANLSIRLDYSHIKSVDPEYRNNGYVINRFHGLVVLLVTNSVDDRTVFFIFELQYIHTNLGVILVVRTYR